MIVESAHYLNKVQQSREDYKRIMERFADGKSPKFPEPIQFESPSPTIVHENTSKSTEDNGINSIELINQINQLKQQVHDLQIENHKLKLTAANSMSLAEEKVSKKLHEEKEEKVRQKISREQERINKRKSLLRKYAKVDERTGKHYFDSLMLEFFHEWGFRVVLLTNGKLFSKGSLDIISEQDFKRELERGHVVRELTAKEVQKYGIFPVKATSQGIEVHSRKTGDRKVLYY